MATSSDIVTLNVGGRRFTTTITTLESSGAEYFRALFLRWSPASSTAAAQQVTPSNSRKRDREEGESVSPRYGMGDRPSEIFVDTDPDVFNDVLYFMRRQMLNPSVLADPCTLIKLQAEGEFFAYDALVQACEKQLKLLKKVVQTSIDDQSARKKVESRTICVSSDDDLNQLTVPGGHVLYISHAVLGGSAYVRRYRKDKDSKGTIPGCFLDTYHDGEGGDFRLKYKDAEEDDSFYDLAHIGKDHIHCGDRPLDMDFSVPVHKCIFAAEDEETLVDLASTGSGSWSVHYYIAYPERIPFLNFHAKEGPSVPTFQQMDSIKRARREGSQEVDSTEDGLATLALAMMASTMLFAQNN